MGSARHLMLLRTGLGVRGHVGELCCGWCSGSQALNKLGIAHEMTFAADIAKSVRKFVQDNFECNFVNLFSFTKQLSSRLEINHVIQKPTERN